MVAIAILTHGDFGHSLLQVAEMMLGPQDNVAVVTIGPSDNIDSFQQQAEKAISPLNTEQGLLFLTDILGGTPANTALRWVSQGQGTLITGINVPMLLEILGARETEPADTLAWKAKDWGFQGIQVLQPANFRQQGAKEETHA